MVYDVTKRSSFESVVRWLKELKANAEPDVAIMIVGNKVDLCTTDPTARQVTKEEGEKLAASQKTMFEETSATQNINVKSTFETLMNRTVVLHIICGRDLRHRGQQRRQRIFEETDNGDEAGFSEAGGTVVRVLIDHVTVANVTQLIDISSSPCKQTHDAVCSPPLFSFDNITIVK